MRLALYNNNEPSALKDADRPETAKELLDIVQSLSFLCELVKTGKPILNSTLHTHLGLAEHAMKRISELTGYQAVKDEVHEKDVKALRAANQRIRELEQKIGQAMTASELSAGIRHYAEILETWYSALGFHYGSITPNVWGLNVHFRGELEPPEDAAFGDKVLMEDMLKTMTPLYGVSGFKIEKAPDGIGYDDVRFTETNVKILSQIIARDFPSARVPKFEIRENDEHILVLDFGFHAPYADIEALYRRFRPAKETANLDKRKENDNE